MQGYRIFNYERDVLIRQKMADGNFYNPRKDINGDYFIFDCEQVQCGLGQKMEFVPPTKNDNPDND